MKRFIFDLDHTILTSSFDEEKNFFRRVLSSDDYLKINDKIPFLLNEYEFNYTSYSVDELGMFLSEKTGTNITEEIIEDWIELVGNTKDQIEYGVIDLFEHIKDNDMEIAVLTNWFTKSQKKRLERANLLPYIDEIYGGDVFLKPYYRSYYNAAGDNRISDCIMIGDDFYKDYLGAKAIGMKSILYDKNEMISGINDSVKSLVKVINKY